jgi:uracil-DNA glycosylase family 4
MTGSFPPGLSDGPLASLPGAATYAEFRSRLAAFDCRACGLAAGRTRLVIDRGNPAARLMVIGEGPGREEDLAGQAFVGRSGRLLDELLAAIGLDTGRDLLIANVVKCRPPDNRAPRAEEARACLPLLSRQIELVAPRGILLLGATASRFLFPERRNLTMREEVGRLFSHPAHPGVTFMLLYHPAYLLRDPRKRKEMREHLETFRRWRELALGTA